MGIKKTYRRFREFGGLNLIRTYWRMGVLGTVAREIMRYLIGQSNRNRMYSRIQQRIAPMLREQYYPLLLTLKEKYKNIALEQHQSNKVWFCWLQGLDNAPELVKVCLRSQQKLLTDREIIVITLDNYTDYVQLPDSPRYQQQLSAESTQLSALHVPILYRTRTASQWYLQLVYHSMYQQSSFTNSSRHALSVLERLRLHGQLLSLPSVLLMDCL